MDSAMIASLLSYGNIAIKLAVGLIGFLWVLRTTNRCQLAQMTPVDLIGNFVMGGIIGGVIYNQDITTVQFIIVLAIWQLLVLGVNALRIHTESGQKMIVGRPTPVVIKGKYLQDKFELLGLDIADFATLSRIPVSYTHLIRSFHQELAMEERTCDIIVLGGGPAGMTAAIYAKRANLDVVLLETNVTGGLVNSTYTVENFPSYPEIHGMELMEKMREHVDHMGVEVEEVFEVTGLELGEDEKAVHGEDVYKRQGGTRCFDGVRAGRRFLPSFCVR